MLFAQGGFLFEQGLKLFFPWLHRWAERQRGRA